MAADRPDSAGGTIRSKGNVLVGGLGSDSVTGGTGPDTIYTTTEQTFGVDAAGQPDTLTTPSGQPTIPNIVETGSGDDVVYGSREEDVVTSHSSPSEHARILGGGGEDALVGGYGSDAVYGGPGDDYVVAEPSRVGGLASTETIEGVTFGHTRVVEHLPLPDGTAPSPKTLVGGRGSDHVIGGDGPSTIFGDTLRDAATVAQASDETCRAGSPVASDPVPEGTSGGSDASTDDGPDLITGGAGVDTISAGGAADRVDARGGDDLVCGQQGDDVLFGGDGADRAWGGTGQDRGYGGQGLDLLFGNAGPDVLYGQEAADVIEGNDGADWASGGDGDDLVYGGTRAAGRADTDPSDAGDVLSGDTGRDLLVGDNGTVDDPSSTPDAAAVPLDLAGTSPDAGRGDQALRRRRRRHGIRRPRQRPRQRRRRRRPPRGQQRLGPRPR